MTWALHLRKGDCTSGSLILLLKYMLVTLKLVDTMWESPVITAQHETNLPCDEENMRVLLSSSESKRLLSLQAVHVAFFCFKKKKIKSTQEICKSMFLSKPYQRLACTFVQLFFIPMRFVQTEFIES